MQAWRLWCKALGEKATSNNKESDTVAIIRTLILFSYLVTNAFIISNTIRHWGDVKQCPEYLPSIIKKI